ncbi:hypothetical protein CAter282_3968 [Collimonas arenae]|uniref:Uncharacterized protein n=1 Tax=Collimonas arenae TaxID=279058 RepID=A0A127PV96_9BURK|nr:hypothetical protein CAter10_4324 [Collimonas arenae]AMP11637.1 hypothetical protein CAter282_3968 [Collimonas arenae]
MWDSTIGRIAIYEQALITRTQPGRRFCPASGKMAGYKHYHIHF